MIELFTTLVSIILVFFLPGFLVVALLHRELETIHKILISFLYSAFIDVIIVFFLGGSKEIALVTGGLTFFNIVFLIVWISVVLSIVLYFKKKRISS